VAKIAQAAVPETTTTVLVAAPIVLVAVPVVAPTVLVVALVVAPADPVAAPTLALARPARPAADLPAALPDQVEGDPIAVFPSNKYPNTASMSLSGYRKCVW
jgi:hypothetical protein